MVQSYTFVNTEYKDEWAQKTPTGKEYKNGVYHVENGIKHVEDGAQVNMGDIMPDGTFVNNSANPNAQFTEYQLTFLRAAAKGGVPVIVDEAE